MDWPLCNRNTVITLPLMLTVIKLQILVEKWVMTFWIIQKHVCRGKVDYRKISHTSWNNGLL